MNKFILQDAWQPEDDVMTVIEKWIAEDNAKIPKEIRARLREFFPHIGISSDEADLIPQSVAMHIIMHSQAYKKYTRELDKRAATSVITSKSYFEEEFLMRLQALYAILAFYAEFLEMVGAAKQAGAFYVNAASIKIELELLKREADLRPNTKAEETLLSFLMEIEKSLSIFESIVPVDVVRYIGYIGYQIPSDTVATYSAVESMEELIDLKKRAEELFFRYGYVQVGRNIFEKGGL